jgi:hydrogenase expression/formation protein HypC
MCLAVPVRVVEIGAADAAVVDLGGIRKEISLALVDDVKVGDYVILHVGYALTKLDPAEAERTLTLFAQAGLSLPRLADDSSPFKGEDGMGLELEAHHGTPSPPLPPPLEGEGKKSAPAAAGHRSPSPPLPPPLEGEGNVTAAAAGRRG